MDLCGPGSLLCGGMKGVTLGRQGHHHMTTVLCVRERAKKTGTEKGFDFFGRKES